MIVLAIVSVILALFVLCFVGGLAYLVWRQAVESAAVGERDPK